MINRPLQFGCQLYCTLTVDCEVINHGITTSFIHRLWGIVRKKKGITVSTSVQSVRVHHKQLNLTLLTP